MYVYVKKAHLGRVAGMVEFLDEFTSERAWGEFGYLTDKGYDSDAFREALIEREISPCIPPRAKRRAPATYCTSLYKQRHKIENMFAKLKDWRRISTRYDRCAHTFFSAICIAATVIFWLDQ